jgi:hypothetical protein
MSVVSYLEIVISNKGGTLSNIQNCIPHEAYRLTRDTTGTKQAPAACDLKFQRR